jgi:hypothetical protein
VLLAEHELVRQRGPRRRRRVGHHRDGLGDAAGDRVGVAVGLDRDDVLAGIAELALEARGKPGVLEVVK